MIQDRATELTRSVQGFGLLVVLKDVSETGALLVQATSENSKEILGRSPQELFALQTFLDIFTEDQATDLMDRVLFLRDKNASVDAITREPEIFALAIETSAEKSKDFWCALQLNPAEEGTIICELDPEGEKYGILLPTQDPIPTVQTCLLDGAPIYTKSTGSMRKARQLSKSRSGSARRGGRSADIRVLDFMSHTQERVRAAPDLRAVSETLARITREGTGFPQVAVYQFDESTGSRMLAKSERPNRDKSLPEPPGCGMSEQCTALQNTNAVGLLYDCDLQDVRLLYRPTEDSIGPLDLTNSHLRAALPMLTAYLRSRGVRSSISIPVNSTGETWGLIVCYSYDAVAMRLPFLTRKLCQFISIEASRNIERLMNISRIRA